MRVLTHRRTGFRSCRFRLEVCGKSRKQWNASNGPRESIAERTRRIAVVPRLLNCLAGKRSFGRRSLRSGSLRMTPAAADDRRRERRRRKKHGRLRARHRRRRRVRRTHAARLHRPRAVDRRRARRRQCARGRRADIEHTLDDPPRLVVRQMDAAAAFARVRDEYQRAHRRDVRRARRARRGRRARPRDRARPARARAAGNRRSCSPSPSSATRCTRIDSRASSSIPRRPDICSGCSRCRRSRSIGRTA